MGPGLADIRMSPSWTLLELRMMAVVVTTGAIRRAKLQSNHHQQQTNTQLFTCRMPFLSPNQQCQSSEGKQIVNKYDTTQRNSVIRPVIIAESSNNATFSISFSASHLRM